MRPSPWIWKTAVRLLGRNFGKRADCHIESLVTVQGSGIQHDKFLRARIPAQRDEKSSDLRNLEEPCIYRRFTERESNRSRQMWFAMITWSANAVDARSRAQH